MADFTPVGGVEANAEGHRPGYTISDSTVTDPGLDATNALGFSTDHKLATFIADNSGLGNSPDALLGYAQAHDLNANQVSAAAKYMLLHHHIDQYLGQQTQQESLWGAFTHTVFSGVRSAVDSWQNALFHNQNEIQGFNSGGVLGALGANASQDVKTAENIPKDVSKVAGAIPGAVEGIGKKLYNIQMQSEAQQAEAIQNQGFVKGVLGSSAYPGIISGATQGTDDIAKFVWDVAKRFGVSSEELMTLGFEGPKGNWLGNIEDLGATFANAIRSTGDLVNPFSKSNGFMLMAHTMAFYQSVAAKYGWAHAMGYALPSVMASLATDGAVSAGVTAEDAVTAASDDEVINTVNNALSSNEPISDDLKASYEKAMERRAARLKAQKITEEGQAGSKAMKASEKFFDYSTRPLSSMFKAARSMGKPMASVKMNALYLTTQESALKSSDPWIKDMWDKTRNGIAYDASGRPMGTDGQVLASYFGLDKGSMFFSPVSGLTDFYTKWIGADPLGAYGKAVGGAFSFDGFSGMLGRWFGGLGVRSADDVQRAYNEYGRVRRAFQYMATHNAAEIADAFRNTYSNDAVRDVSAGSLLSRLGEAKTVDEVIKIHQDVAEGFSMTKGMVPTMTYYEVTKAALKGKLGEILHTVGDAFETDGRFREYIAKAVMEQTGVDIRPNNALLYIANGDSVLSTTAFARWLSTRFTRDAMYIDDLLGKVENRVVRVGSADAIPAIMDFLRSCLMDETTIKTVGDALLHTTNKQDYINVYRHAMYHAVMRRVTAGMNKAELSVFLATSSDHVWNEVIRMTGLDGGSRTAFASIAGEFGADAAQTVNSDAAKFGGIGLTHLGELRFPRAAELRGLAKRTEAITATIYASQHGQELATQLLKLEDLQKLAEFHGADLNGADEVVRTKIQEAVKKIEPVATRFEASGVSPETHAINKGAEQFKEDGGRVLYMKNTKRQRRMLFNQAADIRIAANVMVNRPQEAARMRTLADAIEKIASGAEGHVAIIRGDVVGAATTRMDDNGVVKIDEMAHMPGHGTAHDAIKKAIAKIAYGTDSPIEGAGLAFTPDEVAEIASDPKLAETDMVKGYNTGHDGVQSIIAKHMADKYAAESEKLANAYDEIRAEVFNIQPRINSLADEIARGNSESLFAYAMGMGDKPADPKELIQEMNSLKGRQTAFQDAATELARRMESPTYTEEELRNAVIALREATHNSLELSEMLKTGRGYKPPEMKKFIADSYSQDLQDEDLYEMPASETGWDRGVIDRLKDRLQETFPGNPETAQKFIDQLNSFADMIGKGMFKGLFTWKVGGESPIALGVYPQAGNYNPYDTIMNIFDKALRNPAYLKHTLVHELWHHLSTYAPDGVLKGLRDELTSAQEDFLSKFPLREYINSKDYAFEADPEEKKYLESLASKFRGAENIPVNQIDFRRLPYYIMRYGGRNYHLANLDEYFAEKMTFATEDTMTNNPTLRAARRIFGATLEGIGAVHGNNFAEEVFKDFWEQRFTDFSPVKDTLTMRLKNLDAQAFNALVKDPPIETVQKLVKEMYAAYKGKNPYTLAWQRTADGINRFLSKTFVPLALFSGGWALRVGASEATLNSLRFGGWASFDAKVMTAIAKHEARGLMALEDATKERGLIRNVVAGALLGVEKNIVRGMDQFQRDRMLDDFVGTIIRHNGHLPGGVHEVEDTVFNDKTVENAMAGLVLGVDDKGRFIMADTHSSKDGGWGYLSSGSADYVRALREHITRLANDPLLNPTSKKLEEIFYEAGLKSMGGDLNNLPREVERLSADEQRQEIISAGASQYRTPESVEILREQLEQTALDSINSLSEADRVRFDRDLGRLNATSPLARNSAHEEWAAVIAENAIKSVMGKDETGYIFHSPLVMQAANPETIKSMDEFTRDLNGMGATAPTNIPSSMTKASAPGRYSLQHLTQVGHDKFLGPIVNKMVREPTFLLEQHYAMEKLRDLVKINAVDEETAQAMADERAFRNMSKYVHNPKDKTLWEVNMRVAAPFYFAQNQAWRRAFRVMREDPGAFEKYLKLSLGVTNYISSASSGGNIPSIFIPGSTWLGKSGAIAGTRIDPNSPGWFFNQMNFGFAFDPISVSSVFPTGSTGFGRHDYLSDLGLFRPSWGPVVTIPIKMSEFFLNKSHTWPMLSKVLNAWVLGPASANSSLYSDFFPNTAARDLLEVGVSLAGVSGIPQFSTDALNSTENLVINNAMDNLYTREYENVYNKYDWNSINPDTGNKWTQQQIVQYCRGQADLSITKMFNQVGFTQKFLDEAHAQAIVMFLVKSVLQMGSPVALSLQEKFSADPEFQKILDSVDPLTKQKYTLQSASAKFAEKFPTHLYDLVAHSSGPYETWAETTSAVQFIQDHPNVARQFPNASAMLITRGNYSPQAYQLEASLGLRQTDAPQDYINALLVSAGNDYYYNYLATEPQFGGNGSTAGQAISYEQYTALSTAAKQYGMSSNPTWYTSFVGAQRHNLEINAFKEMNTMLKSKDVPDAVFGGAGEKAKFENLIQQYNGALSQVNDLVSVGDKTIANYVRQEWYAFCLQAAANPYYKNQGYFLTSVLAKLPTAN